MSHPRFQVRPFVAGGAALLVVGGLVTADFFTAVTFPGGPLALLVWPLLVAATTWLAFDLRRIASWRGKLILAGVSTVLLLGALELLLPTLMPELGLPRLRGLRSATLHHALPANTTLFAGRFESEDPVLVVTNQDGLRTHYDRQSFARQPRRVAVLGDSFVFGWGVSSEQAWPTKLEQLFASRHGSDGSRGSRGAPAEVAVLNAGVFSYSPLLARRQWHQLVASYQPQLVVLCLDASDIGDDWKYSAATLSGDGQGPFPWPDQRGLIWRGAVAELARPVWDVLRPALLYPLRRLRHVAAPKASYYDFRLEIGGVVETNRFFIYRHPLELTRPYFAASWDNVEALARDVTAAGANFAVVVFPRFQHWNPDEAPNNWEEDQYGRHEPYQDELFRFYAERAAEVDFPVFDLTPAFRATDRAPLVFANDPHWNEAGNAFVAEVLLDPVTSWLDATE